MSGMREEEMSGNIIIYGQEWNGDSGWTGLPHNEIPWPLRTPEQQHEWNIARIKREYPCSGVVDVKPAPAPSYNLWPQFRDLFFFLLGIAFMMAVMASTHHA